MADTPQLALFAEAAQNRIDQELTDILDSLRLNGCPLGLITLLAGSPKDTDLVSQYAAVDDLLSAGFAVKEICQATRLSTAALTSILRVAALPPTLQGAIRTGAIKRGVALRLVKLTPAEVAKASVIFAENRGTLTGDDLSGLREVTRAAAAQSLPDALFAPQVIPGWDAPVDLVDELAKLIKQFGQMEVEQALESASSVVAKELYPEDYALSMEMPHAEYAPA